MNAIVVRAQLNSTTLSLPELAPLIGKYVEIVVCEDCSADRAPFSSSPTAASEFLEEAVGELSRLA